MIWFWGHPALFLFLRSHRYSGHLKFTWSLPHAAGIAWARCWGAGFWKRSRSWSRKSSHTRGSVVLSKCPGQSGCWECRDWTPGTPSAWYSASTAERECSCISGTPSRTDSSACGHRGFVARRSGMKERGRTCGRWCPTSARCLLFCSPNSGFARSSIGSGNSIYPPQPPLASPCTFRRMSCSSSAYV